MPASAPEIPMHRMTSRDGLTPANRAALGA